MAVTKIHAIKGTLNKALAYIENPDKTEDQILVSGYNVDPLVASIEMEMTAALARETRGGGKRGTNLAYHLIQSFSPDDNVTPEQAHEIGKQLADEFLEGKYEYVITTHVDKEHIHNHIIFNAVSFYDLKKFETRPYKTAAKIRAISDRLCAENDLSVIPQGGKLGYSYKEWSERQNNNSWKSEIRKRMKFLLRMATSYEELKDAAEKIGVIIDERGKEITYRLEGQVRCIRAGKLSDTDTFQKENLIQCVAQNAEVKEYLQAEIRKTITGAESYSDFLQKLKEKGITIRRQKSGEIVYKIDDMDGSKLSEAVLGSDYSTDSIKQALRTGRIEFTESAIDIVAEYGKTARRKIQDKELVEIPLQKEFIKKITAEGMLIDLPDREGAVFIDNRHIDLEEATGKYSIYIGSDFDYYTSANMGDPDVAEADKLSNKSIKGEKIIRAMQLINGEKPIQIECTTVGAISDRGISVTLTNGKSCFIETEYVELDRQEGRCWINIYPSWNYSIRGEKNRLESITGSDLLKHLREQESAPVQEQNTIIRKIRAAEKRINIAEVNTVAETLLLLRQEGFESRTDITAAIAEMQAEAASLSEKMEEIRKKNSQYKVAAKYLLAYQETLPVQKELEKCGLLHREKYRRQHESELQKHYHAIKQLEKMGVNASVDPDKVIELVRSQDTKVRELTDELEGVQERLSRLQTALQVVDRVESEQRPQQKKKENREEK